MTWRKSGLLQIASFSKLRYLASEVQFVWYSDDFRRN